MYKSITILKSFVYNRLPVKITPNSVIRPIYSVLILRKNANFEEVYLSRYRLTDVQNNKLHILITILILVKFVNQCIYNYTFETRQIFYTQHCIFI